MASDSWGLFMGYYIFFEWLWWYNFRVRITERAVFLEWPIRSKHFHEEVLMTGKNHIVKGNQCSIMKEKEK